MSRSIADFSESFTLSAQWKRYVGVIKSTINDDGGTLSFRIPQSGATVYLNNVKLEKANQNLISTQKNGIFKENNIDEENFNTNVKFRKSSSNIEATGFIEK